MNRRHPDAKPPYRQPAPTREGGPRRCRWCWADITAARRTTFCQQACVDEFRTECDWGFCTRAVYRRDRGVCAMCGCDTDKIKRVFHWASKWEWRLSMFGVGGGLRGSWQSLHNTKRSGRGGGYEVDHIVQRREGGTNELSNLRTLCVECHAAETARYAGQRAERARAGKALLFAGETDGQ